MDAHSYINGKFLKREPTKKTINPATLETVTEYSIAVKEDIENSINIAQKGFELWNKINVTERGLILKKVADLIDLKRREIAELITREEGKTISESLNEVNNAYKILYYYFGESRRVTSYVVQSEQNNVFASTIRVPLGIVYIITPFNSPFSIPFWNIAPALLHGNSVIFKPSHITAGVGHMISLLFDEAGVPPGVFNTIIGDADLISNTILNDKRVQLVAFTGGTDTGNKLSVLNGKYKRRQILELGGKNAAIVLSDANLDLAVSSLLFASFSNAGQRCTASSRIIVEEGIEKEFIDKFTFHAKKIVVGNGLDPNVRMGPVAGENQYKKVKSYIERACEKGLNMKLGKCNYDETPNGYFIYPTIFVNVNKDDELFKDEIFGPIVSITTAKNLDEAIELANYTKYGLVSAIYTKDIKSAFRAVNEIDSGVTFVNQGPTGIEYSLPYLGHKESGFGEELGLTSIMNYTKTKSIYIDYSYEKRPFFW
ncbi:MAG: aldehyde dehydrogenase family protein [Thermoplasmata archaeon]